MPTVKPTEEQVHVILPRELVQRLRREAVRRDASIKETVIVALNAHLPSKIDFVTSDAPIRRTA